MGKDEVPTYLRRRHCWLRSHLDVPRRGALCRSCSAAAAPNLKRTGRSTLTTIYALQDPPYDANSFAKIVTRDASSEAGSAAACVPNMRKGWQILLNGGESESGRELISDAMRLCPHSAVDSKYDAIQLAQWLQSAWDYLAMVCATHIMHCMSVR